MANKRYYWLKLEEQYFDSKIQKAIKRNTNNNDILICYLKIQLKYLKTDGFIEYQGICDDLYEEIALDIDEDVDLIKQTISILIKYKAVEQEGNNLYLIEMQERIGSKTDSALRVAKHREKIKMLQCNIDVTKCNPIKRREEIEKDKREDKRVEVEKTTTTTTQNDIFTFIEKNFGRTLSPIEYQEIATWQDCELTRHAITQAVLNGVHNIKYISRILENYKIKNIQTIIDAQNNEKKFKQRNSKNNIEISPQWINEDVEEEQATAEEIAELEERLKKQ